MLLNTGGTSAVQDCWYESYPDLHNIGFGTWPERYLVRELMQLFHNHPMLPEAFVFFSRVTTALRTWWRLERRRRDDGGQRDYELEYAAEDAVAGFLLDCSAVHANELLQLLLKEVDEIPDKVASLLGSLLSHEDGRTSTSPSNYWQLWTDITNKVKTAAWLGRIDDEHSHGRALIRECFLNTRWKDGISSWSRLGSNFERVDALFEQLPASPFVFKCYLHYLYHIGRDSIPRAFVLIARKFGDTLGDAITNDGNLCWYLEVLISRSMFDGMVMLRKDGTLRAAIMAILDGMVHAGSSVAFQLRDDFVTPFSGCE